MEEDLKKFLAMDAELRAMHRRIEHMQDREAIAREWGVHYLMEAEASCLRRRIDCRLQTLVKKHTSGVADASYSIN